MKNLLVVAAAFSVLATAPAAAAVVQGDFRAEANLPDYRSGQAKVHENLGAILGDGLELSGVHLVSNPDSWNGGVVTANWDAATNILTLDSLDSLDFQIFNFSVSNILFDQAQKITGISHIGGNLVTNGVLPSFNFTDNSINIAYARQNVFYFTGGSAQYQITLSDVAGSVPEPTTWAMLILGFGAVGFAARRQRKDIALAAI